MAPISDKRPQPQRTHKYSHMKESSSSASGSNHAYKNLLARVTGASTHTKEYNNANSIGNTTSKHTKRGLEILDFHESWLEEMELYKGQLHDPKQQQHHHRTQAHAHHRYSGTLSSLAHVTPVQPNPQQLNQLQHMFMRSKQYEHLNNIGSHHYAGVGHSNSNLNTHESSTETMVQKPAATPTVATTPIKSSGSNNNSSSNNHSPTGKRRNAEQLLPKTPRTNIRSSAISANGARSNATIQTASTAAATNEVKHGNTQVTSIPIHLSNSTDANSIPNPTIMSLKGSHAFQGDHA